MQKSVLLDVHVEANIVVLGKKGNTGCFYCLFESLSLSHAAWMSLFSFYFWSPFFLSSTVSYTVLFFCSAVIRMCVVTNCKWRRVEDVVVVVVLATVKLCVSSCLP